MVKTDFVSLRRTQRATLLYVLLAGLSTLCLWGCNVEDPALCLINCGAGGGPPVSAPASALGTGGSGANMGIASNGPVPELRPLQLRAPGDIHNCTEGEPPDPRDALISNEPAQWVASNGDIDLVLPSPVLAWMSERIWQGSHDAWHNIRRCQRGGAFGGFGGFGAFGRPGFGGSSFDICSYTDMIPDNQECQNARDGYEFLVMHRHMIIGLKQAFPEHKDLFEAFPSFPFEAKDVPAVWQNRWGTGWSRSILQTARLLENIEDNLDQFPTEGDLGQYIQCGNLSAGASSIHGAMHFKWVVNSSPHSLGNQAVNVENYLFWKLHGWIDNVWERYRIAKGIAGSPNDSLEDELVAQCWEMHDLGHVVDPTFGVAPDIELPDEFGFFHENVRPILEKTCAGCHSETSPAGNMSLGGQISSADIVAQLVNQGSFSGGQFRRVVPGQPEQSWLYLKASDTAIRAGCVGKCNAQVMPPAGRVTLTQAELDVIYRWIADGAQAPTQ